MRKISRYLDCTVLSPEMIQKDEAEAISLGVDKIGILTAFGGYL